MSTLTTPSSIATGSSDPYWATLVSSGTTSNPDTTTKKHYAATGSGGPTDVVFELNNGIITVDVNAPFTGTDWPDFVSKDGFQINGASSITVTPGDTIYLFNQVTQFGSFVWDATWTSTPPVLQGASSYSGTLTVDGINLDYEIPATSSAGTYMLMSSASATPHLNIVHGSTLSSGVVPNFDQTKIWTLLSPTEDELDRISPPQTRKKVSCNFW